MEIPKEVKDYIEANTKSRMEQALEAMDMYCKHHKISMGELLKLIDAENN